MLPLPQTEDTQLGMILSRWKSLIDPLFAKRLTQGLLLKNIELSMGQTAVNHLLQRKLQGWFIVRKRAAAEIYDEQDSNPIPEATLLLISDADVEVDLWVF